MKANKVLVTGADGFIGSHLTELLVSRGLAVRAFSLYNSFNRHGWLDALPEETQSRIEIFSGDIRDPEGVRTAMAGCDAVLHLAALIAIPYSYHSPDTYVDVNVKGTLHVLQAARSLGVAKVVHTSTSEVYGTAKTVPMDENHPLQAQSPYSATKIAADQLALSFHRSFGTPVTVLRPFNTYGPRQSMRAVLPTIIAQLASGKRSVKLGAVSPTRDFNYVADTARAFLAAMETDGNEGEVMNAGSGYEISVGDAVRLIAELMGVEARIECDEQRLRPGKSEVERLCADSTRFQAFTGWRPEYGGPEGLRRGLSETIAWFTKPENLAQDRTERYVV